MRAKGMDISKWQWDDNRPGDPNVQLMTDDEDFLIFKYSQNLAKDRILDWWYKNIHGLRPTSGYHFAEYDRDAKAQAKFFIDLLRIYPTDFPAALDLEMFRRSGVIVPYPTPYNLVTWLFSFGDIYREEFKYWPMLYINGSTSLLIQGSKHPRLNELKQWPLWISYPGLEQGIYNNKYLGIWDKWIFWQFTWKYDGFAQGVESAGLDYNYFNGSSQDFIQWVLLYNDGIQEPVPTPEPKPQPIVTPIKLQVLRNQYIRKGGYPTAPILSRMRQAGEIVNVEQIGVYNYHSVWAKDKEGWSAITHNGLQYMKEVI